MLVRKAKGRRREGEVERKKKREMKREKKREKKKEMKRKSICIVCGKEKEGREIEEDIVVRGIRLIKRKLNIERGNILVVCDECLEEAKKRRQKFEKGLFTWGAIGGILGIILIISSALAGGLGRIISSFIFLLILIVVFVCLSFYQYFPKVKEY